MAKLVWVLAALLLFGCAKETNQNPNDAGFAGTWRHTQVYVSPGNGGAWQPVNNPSPVTITFTDDGRVVSNHHWYGRFPRYEIHGDTLVMAAVIDNYPREARGLIEQGTLEIGYACICGCADRFTRVGSAVGNPVK